MPSGETACGSASASVASCGACGSVASGVDGAPDCPEDGATWRSCHASWQGQDLTDPAGADRGVEDSSTGMCPALLPSAGSRLHSVGRCKPCAFFHTKGCMQGPDCPFCHLCPPFERQRRKRLKQQLCRSILSSLEHHGDGTPLKHGHHSRQSSASSSTWSWSSNAAGHAWQESTPFTPSSSASFVRSDISDDSELNAPESPAVPQLGVRGAPPPEAQNGRPWLPRRGPQQARGVRVHPPMTQHRWQPPAAATRGHWRLPPSQTQSAPVQLPQEQVQSWAPMPVVTGVGAVIMQPVGYPTVLPMQPVIFPSMVPIQQVSYSAAMPMQGMICMPSGNVCPERGQAEQRQVPPGPQMEQVQEEDLDQEEEAEDEDDEDDEDSECEDDEADEE